MKKIRPALRYLGGKWKLAKWIIEHFPPHRIYTEAFGGAASVLMQKPRSYSEVYNDRDDEIVNVFRVLRDPDTAMRLKIALELTPFARVEFYATYVDRGGGISVDPVERARRTIARAKMGYGSDSSNARRKSGFRSNSNRSGTTPAHDWRNYPPEIAGFVDRLQSVVIENLDALYVIRYFDGPLTLHYVDPPYVACTRGRAQRYRYEMSDDGHRELAQLLHAVDGMVVLSGYACALYDELYRDWERTSIETHADGARPRTEYLWLSPRTAAALHPKLFA